MKCPQCEADLTQQYNVGFAFETTSIERRSTSVDASGKLDQIGDYLDEDEVQSQTLMGVFCKSCGTDLPYDDTDGIRLTIGGS